MIFLYYFTAESFQQEYKPNIIGKKLQESLAYNYGFDFF